MKMKREANKNNVDKIYFNTASNIEYKMVSKKDANWLVFSIYIERT